MDELETSRLGADMIVNDGSRLEEAGMVESLVASHSGTFDSSWRRFKFEFLPGEDKILFGTTDSSC